MSNLYIVIGVVVLFILYRLYVGVVKARTQLDEALSGIDVQLKQRHSLIPNILTTAKKFMEHEDKIFTEITKLRSQADQTNIGTKERFDLETKIDRRMAQFALTAENYPELKSSATMVKAMENYTNMEDNIAAARRFYNTALRDLTNKVRIFPSSLFKGFAGDISSFTYFEATAEEKQEINAADYFK